MRSGSERGQATVEFVLVLPVIVLLVLAVVQIGVVARERVVLAHVAREAARQVAVDPRPEVAVTAAQQASGLDARRLSVTIRPNGRPEPRSGDRVTVEVDYRAPTNVPVIGRLVGDIVLNTDVVVRVE